MANVAESTRATQPKATVDRARSPSRDRRRRGAGSGPVASAAPGSGRGNGAAASVAAVTENRSTRSSSLRLREDRHTPRGPPPGRPLRIAPSETTDYGVGQRRPGLGGPRSEVPVGHAGAGQAGVGIDPQERPRPAEVPEGAGGVPPARPV